MNIWDYLPCFPWEGPPLPRMMKIVWPWANTASAPSATNTLNSFFNGGRGQNTPAAPANNAPAYENLEEIELQDIDPDLLMPRKIVVHRKYKQRAE